MEQFPLSLFDIEEEVFGLYRLLDLQEEMIKARGMYKPLAIKGMALQSLSSFPWGGLHQYTDFPSRTKYDLTMQGIGAKIGEFIKKIFKAVADFFKRIFKRNKDVAKKVEELKKKKVDDFKIVAIEKKTGVPIDRSNMTNDIYNSLTALNLSKLDGTIWKTISDDLTKALTENKSMVLAFYGADKGARALGGVVLASHFTELISRSHKELLPVILNFDSVGKESSSQLDTRTKLFTEVTKKLQDFTQGYKNSILSGMKKMETKPIIEGMPPFLNLFKKGTTQDGKALDIEEFFHTLIPKSTLQQNEALQRIYEGLENFRYTPVTDDPNRDKSLVALSKSIQAFASSYDEVWRQYGGLIMSVVVNRHELESKYYTYAQQIASAYLDS